MVEKVHRAAITTHGGSGVLGPHPDYEVLYEAFNAELYLLKESTTFMTSFLYK